VVHGLGDSGNMTSDHQVRVVGVTSDGDGVVDWRLGGAEMLEVKILHWICIRVWSTNI
jgi:hypothetical protein